MSHWFKPGHKLPGTKGQEKHVDLWRTDYADLWFRLVTFGIDWEIERWALDEIGECPDQFLHAIDECGYDLWFDYSHDWMGFALENGIAPRQPFLVRLYPPVYTQSYEGDWDCDAEWELLRVQYWQRSVALRYWERYLRILDGLSKAA